MKNCESLQYTQIVILSKLRAIGHVTPDVIESAMGIPKGTLSEIESGEREVTADQIERYSNCLQEKLGMKNIDLIEVVKELSSRQKVTDGTTQKKPVDFLYTYLVKCCK